MKIPIEKIIVSRDNPRQSFDEAKLLELGESIKDRDLIQPIIVRPKGEFYELVVGERRLKASKLVGLNMIEAIVRDLDDRQCDFYRLIENTQREDLTEAEKGNALAHVFEAYPEYRIGDVAKELKKSESTINRWLCQSAKLSDFAKKSAQLKRISATVVRGLVTLSFIEQNKIINAIEIYKIPITHEDKQTEFLNHYRLCPEKYPTVESLEDLANEVKGVRRVKIDLDKLSPEARAEIERKLKEAKEEAKRLREKQSKPTRPRVNHRKQGRPKKSKDKDATSPTPVVPHDVKEIPVGSLWLEIPLYEKLFEFSIKQHTTLPETVLFIVHKFFGEE